MKVHHIGYVVENLKRAKEQMVVDEVVRELYDEVQKAQLALIKADNLFIELIEPRSEDSFTYNFLKKGGGYHHLCYEVDVKEDAERLIRDRKMIKVLNWVHAPLLDGEVCFAYNRSKEIVEFVCLEK